MGNKDNETSIGLEVEEADPKVVGDSGSNLEPMVLHNIEEDQVEETQGSISQTGIQTVKKH